MRGSQGEGGGSHQPSEFCGSVQGDNQDITLPEWDPLVPVAVPKKTAPLLIPEDEKNTLKL